MTLNSFCQKEDPKKMKKEAFPKGLYQQKNRTYLCNQPKKWKVTGILLNWGSQQGKNNPIQIPKSSSHPQG